MLAAAAVVFVLSNRTTGERASATTTSAFVAPTTVSPTTQVDPSVTVAATVPGFATSSSPAVLPTLPTVPPTTIPSAGWNGQYVDAPGTGVLRIGHKGERVREMQAALGDSGLLNPPYDGDFGPGTEAVLLEFQRRQGLTADGLAGTRTLAALGLGLGFETYDDATAAALRYLNTGSSTGLARQMISDLRHYAGLARTLSATWTVTGPLASGVATNYATFSVALGGSGGVYTYMELRFLAAPGHSWNGVFNVQSH